MVGVLGGIASGKSQVAAELAGADGVRIDADRIAGEVLESPEVVARLEQRFGPETIGADGRPDRERLAERVFSDPEARAVLEGWIHPRVRATIRERLAAARAAQAPIAVLDVPLLLEHAETSGLADLCDLLVFVDAPPEAREARARSQRGWPAGEVARREAAQLPLEHKRRAAHRVLPNDGSLHELVTRARALRAELLRPETG